MPRPSPSRPAAGFTLVELLIVVAIIAILAAIAVPNFIQAQTRSKVVRVHADLRSVRTALESYTVDHGKPPRMSWGGTPFNDRYTGAGVTNQAIWGTLLPNITTPVAYLSHFDFLDPFVHNDINTDADARLYTYHDTPTLVWLIDHNLYGPVTAKKSYQRNFGSYALMSIGPDREADATTFANFWRQYDPTNGTTSRGNIWFSQRQTDIVIYTF